MTKCSRTIFIQSSEKANKVKAYFRSKTLVFKRPSGTSRGVLKEKKTWYIILTENENVGIGECSPLSGLSIDDRPDYEVKLKEVCERPADFIGSKLKKLNQWPSIKFGLEMAYLDLKQAGVGELYPSEFTDGKQGIAINGLIWMGNADYIKAQIKDLLDRGFNCLKMKIGALNFEDELEILYGIRKLYKATDLILRVDANGAFPSDKALENLKRLSELDLHSIEQPIKAGQWSEMARLCQETPLAIALDEELIPVVKEVDKKRLLEEINPQYIILKPSLLGGFSSSQSWIDKAESMDIGWWVTSALESNIGLNAISQWTYSLDVKGYQGLGTGSLYTNNIESPLEIVGEELFYKPQRNWNLHELF